MAVEDRYLILRTPDFIGRVVTATRKPRIGKNEIGFRLRLHIPDGWGTVVGLLTVDIPELLGEEAPTVSPLDDSY